MAYYSRKSARISNYDYSVCNSYFVTICTHNRRCLFGEPDSLNHLGDIAFRDILQIPLHFPSVHIDHFVVMPNHIHLIVTIGSGSRNPDLNQIIGQYKSGVTRKIRELNPDMDIWQRSFHDHVIRSQKEYEKIWAYIDGNPMNWDKDCFYIDPNIGSAR